MPGHRGPRALLALGVLLFLASVGYGTLTVLRATPGGVAVPAALGGVRLVRQVTGAEAIAEVTRLHGQEFQLTSGAVGRYGDGAATVWVAGAAARPEAEALVRAMTTRLATGRSPFTPTAVRQVQGRTVYELTGMGQRHVYFQAGSLVVWLAVDPGQAERALREVLAFYP